MLKRFMLYPIVAVLIALMCCAASARMVPPFDLQSQMPLGDAICTGRITGSAIRPADSNGSAEWVLTFRVDRVIKGDIVSGTDIEVHYRDSATPTSRYGNIAASMWSPVGWGYVLAALKKSADGYVGVSGDCSMPVAERQNIPYARSGDAMTDLRWEVLNALEDSSLLVVKSALQQTPILTTSQMKTYVEPLIGSAGEDVVLSALVGLVRAGRPGAAVTYLLAHDGSDFTQGALARVKTAVQGTPAVSSADLSTVSQLMNCKSVTLRRVGSYLLRLSRSTSVLPQLKAALGDPDIEVRYNAVMGLADVLHDNSGHAPTFHDYRASEQTHLSYWKSRTAQ